MNGIGLEKPRLGNLTNARVSAYPNNRLVIEDADGNPATLAVLDANGNVIESGDDLICEIEGVCVAAVKGILFSRGWLRVYAPPDQTLATLAA